jgi:hypothetical protein
MLQFRANLTIRNGKITEAELELDGSKLPKQGQETSRSLLNRTLHEIYNWEDLLGSEAEASRAGAWMNIMLGVPVEALAIPNVDTDLASKLRACSKTLAE